MTTRKQSALSRFAGNTNFLLGAIRRCIGAVRYLPFAPEDDPVFRRLQGDAINAIASLEAYTKWKRAHQHAQIKANQERKDGNASDCS